MYLKSEHSQSERVDPNSVERFLALIDTGEKKLFTAFKYNVIRRYGLPTSAEVEHLFRVTGHIAFLYGTSNKTLYIFQTFPS